MIGLNFNLTQTYLELEKYDIADLWHQTPEECLAPVGSGQAVVLVVLYRRF